MDVLRWKEKKKTMTGMGGLPAERCGRRGVYNESDGWGSGDGWWRQQ